MSTAILISGQMRTFAQCYPTQRWHVFRHFPDFHFFIVVQDNDDVWSIDLLRKEYGVDRVHALVIGDPKLTVTPEMSVAYDHAPYANAAPAAQLLMQHWYQQQVWEHFLKIELRMTPEGECSQFDTIIRLRPDQWFHSFEMPKGVGEETIPRYNEAMQPAGSVTVSCPPSPVSCYSPWWGRFGGINDRFAILGREAARAYFTVYERIPELLAEYHCPFHPESLVKAALETAGCTIHETLRTEFTTLRQDGNHRPPEIMPWDLAHAALRNAA